MIQFTCPYCSAELSVGDEYARRQGWCRQCKNVLTIPAGTGQPCTPMGPGERLAALERFFPLAAERADGYRLLYDAAKASISQDQHLVQALDAVSAEQARLDAQLKGQADQLKYLVEDVDARGRRFEEFGHRFARLCADFEADQAWREGVVERLARLESAAGEAQSGAGPAETETIARLDAKMHELGASIGHIESAVRDAGAAAREADAAVHEQLEDLRAVLADAASLAASADGASREARAAVEQLGDAHEGHRRIATELAEALEAARARMDETSRAHASTEEMLQGLAEQVGRLDNMINAFVAEAAEAAEAAAEAAEAAAHAPVPFNQQLAVQSEGAIDGVDMGQQAVLAAFLRFTGQQPREYPPGT